MTKKRAMFSRLCLPISTVIALSLLSACGPQTGDVAAAPDDELPPQWRAPLRFQGEWRADIANCGGPTGETRLIISPETIEFDEASGEIMASSTIDDQWTVVAELTGEGMTWRRTYVFTLQDGGEALVFDDTGLVRRRCPKEN
jgi:hypothetical protein